MKYCSRRYQYRRRRFAPSRGRELKCILGIIDSQQPVFAPSRGRELKYAIPLLQIQQMPLFAPSRGRELKCHRAGRTVCTGVRPLAGAGIEISAEAAYPAWL